jgi:hypothetical protein
MNCNSVQTLLCDTLDIVETYNCILCPLQPQDEHISSMQWKLNEKCGKWMKIVMWLNHTALAKTPTSTKEGKKSHPILIRVFLFSNFVRFRWTSKICGCRSKRKVEFLKTPTTYWWCAKNLWSKHDYFNFSFLKVSRALGICFQKVLFLVTKWLKCCH